MGRFATVRRGMGMKNKNNENRPVKKAIPDGPPCPVHGPCLAYIRLVQSNNEKGVEAHIKSWDRLLKRPDKRAWEAEKQAELMGASLTKDKVLKNALLYEDGPLCLGDPYKDPSFNYRSSQGGTFKNGTTKKGTVGDDILFTRYPPLCEGNEYEDPGWQERKERRANKLREQKLERKPYRPAGPKVTNNPDSTLGGDAIYLSTVDRHSTKEDIKSQLDMVTKEKLERRIRHNADGDVEERGVVRTQTRNIVTNPPKRGGYGVAGTSLAAQWRTRERARVMGGGGYQAVGMAGVGATEEYICDPYISEGDKARAARLEKLQRRKNRTGNENDADTGSSINNADRPSFFPASHGQRNFTADRVTYMGMGESGDPRARLRPLSAVEQEAVRELRDTRAAALKSHAAPVTRVVKGRGRGGVRGASRPMSAPGYGRVEETGAVIAVRRAQRVEEQRIKMGRLSERRQFRPSSGTQKGKEADLAPFPEYIPDPIPEVRRRKPGTGGTTEDTNGVGADGMVKRWVPPTVSKIRPTPSIALSKRNIGAYRI